MKTIEIDDDLFAALEGEVQGFNDTPSSVIRRLLQQSGHSNFQKPAQLDMHSSGPANPFTQLLTSTNYRMANAGSRYLQILTTLHQLHGEEAFSTLSTYRFGERKYFADTPAAIAQSGNNTNPKLIPGTRFYALTTLSNSAKRKIIRTVLRLLKYNPVVIAQVAETLPDSGIIKTPQLIDSVMA